jgi:membrane fusion protein, multidrug efflux system
MDTSTPDHLVAPPSGRLAGLPRAFAVLRSDPKRFRRVLMLGGGGVFLAAGLVFWLLGGRYVGTDDSYIRAAKLLVTTDVSGLVQEVDVKEGQAVKSGQVLFKLDPAPFRIALDNAKAKYAQALLDVRSMEEDYQRMLHDIQAGEAQVQLDQRNYDRDDALVRRGNLSRSNFDQTRMTLEIDQRRLQSLQQQAESQLAKLGGKADLPPEEHPSVRSAQAALDEAQRQLDHATVRAPFEGIVTAVDSLQPGTLLISALSSFSTTSAVALVSTRDLWIEAQMKETDLTDVKAGDPVSIKVDTYPGHRWTGRVDAISPASGASFSVLPAQNASGNWVKVVQRIPVRITLDLKPGDPQLREGMSAAISIDTGRRRWHRMLFGRRS